MKPSTHNTTDERAKAGVPDDLLDLYFDSLGKVPLLTADDEVRLAQQIEAGNAAQERLDAGTTDAHERRTLEREVRKGRAAFDHFIEANLRLVVSVATPFVKRSRLSLDELIQEGNLGLIRAVEKFDWRRGFKFSTYATWWVRQAIQRGIAASERTIRLPLGLHDALLKSRAARNRLEAELGREPTLDELAAASHTSKAKIVAAMEHDHRMASLDKPVGDDEGSEDLGALVAVATDAPDEEVVEEHYLREVVDTARDRLDDRSWQVLVRRFGLLDAEPDTLDEIGRDLGVSRETVRKIERRALLQLRDVLVMN